MNHPIALLTDFGVQDHFVGSLKGVILGINPQAAIFDITHEVRPQNIRDGAFVLYSVYPYVPKGTIFVVVIDPGVGSARRALCVKTNRCFLIAPDNGVLSMILRKEKHFTARAITNDQFFRKPVSNTFHGRDVFAPAAAYLSQKDVFEKFGPRVKQIKMLDISEAVRHEKDIKGEIIYIDRFGNAMTNISKAASGMPVDFSATRVIVKQKLKAAAKSLFCEGQAGALIALWNSTDLLELAVRNGSAEKKFGLMVGDPVRICWR